MLQNLKDIAKRIGRMWDVISLWWFPIACQQNQAVNTAENDTSKDRCDE